jgi:lipopolysaccharide transport system ATP-binding protein
MSDVAIRVDSLGKQYRIGLRRPYGNLRESLAQALLAPWRRLRNGRAKDGPGPSLFWALKDVSLEVRQGEVLGIIGRNGAGKSTLLKVLARITEPTEGQVELDGRVGSLLEVGTGFHPELTGRENVYLNGAILGMRKGEIARKFDEIVAFAEVERFLDTQVKHYSSGMYMRLAFAVAAHLEPEVLIVDEVLAVGDALFQKKCQNKMTEVAQGGRAVLFVSHNTGAVTSLCSRAVLLEQGSLIRDGPPAAVVESYHARFAQAEGEAELTGRKERTGDGRVRLTGVRWEDKDGRPIMVLRSGQDYSLVLDYTCPAGFRKEVVVSFGILDLSGQVLLNHRNDFVSQVFSDIPPRGQFLCRIPKLPLARGNYVLNLYVGTASGPCDSIAGAACVTVEAGDYFGTGHPGDPAYCKTLMEGDWRLRSSAGLG